MDTVIWWLRNQVSLHEFKLTSLSKPYFHLLQGENSTLHLLPSAWGIWGGREEYVLNSF